MILVERLIESYPSMATFTADIIVLAFSHLPPTAFCTGIYAREGPNNLAIQLFLWESVLHMLMICIFYLCSKIMEWI